MDVVDYSIEVDKKYVGKYVKNDVRLRSIKPGKKTETDDVTLHFGNLYRIAQLLIGIRSENYDKPVQTNVEA